MPIVPKRLAAEDATLAASQSAGKIIVPARVRARAKPNTATESAAVQAAAEDSHKVGYKSPPKHTQFKKGRSGNPEGRPKGAKGLKTIVRETLTQKVTIKTAKGPRRVTLIEAMFTKTAEKGLSNERTSLALLQLYREAVPDVAKTASSASETAADMDLHDRAILAELHAALLAQGQPQ